MFGFGCHQKNTNISWQKIAKHQSSRSGMHLVQSSSIPCGPDGCRLGCDVVSKRMPPFTDSAPACRVGPGRKANLTTNANVVLVMLVSWKESVQSAVMAVICICITFIICEDVPFFFICPWNLRIVEVGQLYWFKGDSCFFRLVYCPQNGFYSHQEGSLNVGKRIVFHELGRCLDVNSCGPCNFSAKCYYDTMSFLGYR